MDYHIVADNNFGGSKSSAGGQSECGETTPKTMQLDLIMMLYSSRSRNSNSVTNLKINTYSAESTQMTYIDPYITAQHSQQAIAHILIDYGKKMLCIKFYYLHLHFIYAECCGPNRKWNQNEWKISKKFNETL